MSVEKLEDLCKYVADSYKYGENQNISAYKPFLLDEESKDKSSRFEIECARFKSAEQEINEKIHTVLENIKEISQSKSQEQLIEIIEELRQ